MFRERSVDIILYAYSEMVHVLYGKKLVWASTVKFFGVRPGKSGGGGGVITILRLGHDIR